jgi:hypothetical protein
VSHFPNGVLCLPGECALDLVIEPPISPAAPEGGVTKTIN